ncbi:hypothetical protein XA1311A_15440 [Xanthomonas arboricola]|nr:hypothetical protein XA1311A_15440 [Xanthomonas arboricola]CAE6745713.1 hypothetical protein XA1311A_15440 [Xanthomonas arboricola]
MEMSHKCATKINVNFFAFDRNPYQLSEFSYPTMRQSSLDYFFPRQLRA